MLEELFGLFLMKTNQEAIVLDKLKVNLTIMSSNQEMSERDVHSFWDLDTNLLIMFLLIT